MLAEIWSELLPLQRVGRHDNFFELGGHSLLCIKMAERLRAEGFFTDVREILQTPILHKLAACLSRSRPLPASVPENLIPEGCAEITPSMLPLVRLTPEEIDRVVSRVPGGAQNVQDIYPLAPVQEGLLFHHRLTSGTDTYVLQTLLEVGSRQECRRLMDALQFVIDRHDALRTAVIWEGLTRPVQVVWRRAVLGVTEVALDLQGEPIPQMMERMRGHSVRIPLDRAPLVCADIAVDSTGRTYVLMRLHHIVTDHLALEQVLVEIGAYLRATTSVLANPVPYREYVASAIVDAKECADHFRNLLRGGAQPTAPFGLLDTYGDGTQVHENREAVDTSLAESIRGIAGQYGVSPAVLFHAAWVLVMAATTGQDDVVFGTVLSGRMRVGHAVTSVLGMCVNALPARFRLQGLTVSELVTATSSQLRELVRFEQASLADVQRCSSVPAGTPLFTTLFNFRHTPKDEQSTPNSRLPEGMRVICGHERTNYPFTVSVDDRGDTFELLVQSDKRIDAARMIGYLRIAVTELAEALRKEPTRSVFSLSVLPNTETDRLLHEFNAPVTIDDEHYLVHERFEALAQQTPDALAVIHSDQCLTYEGLNSRANRLAHFLRHRGVASGSHVALLLGRGIEIVVAQLAALKCGAIYVPIDPAFPERRQAFIVGDCRAVLVLGRGTCPSQMFGPAEWIDLHALDEEIRRCSADNLAPLGADESARTNVPAYVMYTSGSSGKPKGVVIPHRGILRLTIKNGFTNIGAEDCVAYGSNPAFDASTFEVWAAILNGARVAVVEPEAMVSAAALEEVILRHGVTVLWLTVGILNHYSQNWRAGFGRLRYLIVGGDVVEPHIVRPVLKRGTPDSVLNGYGPTECTTFSTMYRILSAEGEESIPIGQPLRNTQVYVLGEHRRLAPVGVVGEIYIGGDGVALGYLNQPLLTRECFIEDPFSSRPEARLYRSGDRGRWRADGTLEFLGRSDRQTKLRGFRLELGEIEIQLECHPLVHDAMVVLREKPDGEKQLTAYVVHKGVAPSANSLREHLIAALPEHMVPALYAVLDRWPLTNNGKVDANALPEPEFPVTAETDFSPPNGVIEEALANLWRTVLEVDRIGRNDHFLELGGHSLIAMRLIEQIRVQFSVDVPLQVVFESPTIALLARYIDAQRAHRLAQVLGSSVPADTDLVQQLISMSEEEVAAALQRAEVK